MSGTAVISYHPCAPGRESRLSVSGSRGCSWLFLGAPGVSPGRLFCIRKGGSATAGIPGRTFLSGLTFCPVSPLRNVDYCVFLASGVVGLWSREGCGAGQRSNKHRSVSYCRHSQQDGALSGLTSLSWASNTGSVYDIQAISSQAKASPSTTGNLFPVLGDKN